MARRGKYDPYDFPGLFDGAEYTLSRGGVMSRENLPEHIRLAGGEPMLSHVEGSPLGPIVVKPVPNKVMFMSFGSGSSGNCAYIGDSVSGFLVDAGVEPKQVVEGLAEHKISMDAIKGICITHDHSDHMRYAYTLLKKYRHMHLYCTPRAMNGIMRRHSVSRRLRDYHVSIYKEIPFELGNFTITAFEVFHDGTDNSGFYVQHDDRAFTIATDLGCISERADYYMRRADYIMIESNYDQAMLEAGRYPEYLKARIRSNNGHLDNKVAAEYVAKIFTERLKYVFLCHLSQDNNTPELALAESRGALEASGIKVGEGRNTPCDCEAHVQLVALPRFECSRLYVLRPQ